MLCDELNNPNGSLRLTKWYDRILSRIAECPKFILDHSFAQAADEMSAGKREEIFKFLPWCRLPYSACWIEVAQNDRRSFADSKTPLETTEAPVSRVGYFLEEVPEGWKVHLIWSFVSKMIIRGISASVSTSNVAGIFRLPKGWRMDFVV